MPECMQQLLRDNSKILIIDCIYKTNKYKMLLLIIIEVTCLNISFFVVFCFIKDKNFGNYC